MTACVRLLFHIRHHKVLSVNDITWHLKSHGVQRIYDVTQRTWYTFMSRDVAAWTKQFGWLQSLKKCGLWLFGEAGSMSVFTWVLAGLLVNIGLFPWRRWFTDSYSRLRPPKNISECGLNRNRKITCFLSSAYCPSGEQMTGTATCAPCSVGTHKNNSVSQEVLLGKCQPCPENFTTPDVGAMDESHCTVG